ncbi:MFS transporter [Streptomyces sp. NPDC093568]|uniref:MFS transporter n=1 Tax=Streptomyces sp. NPDC093568 TaxID=3366041 RepID=UPI0037FB1CCE
MSTLDKGTADGATPGGAGPDEEPDAGDASGRRVLTAAALGSAPMEVLDFLLPLWAGSELKAGASAVGALIAVEAVLSLVVRPLAGELSDRFDPRRVAAAGAALYALSFAGYAVADALWTAFVAAGLGGVGGALFWVALDTWTGRRTAGNGTAAYGKLLSVSGQGAFAGYLIAFTVLERGGYRPLFWLGCAACAVAAVLLMAGPSEAAGKADAGEPSGAAAGAAGPSRRLLPLMALAAVTAGAEAGLWMLLLLQLQGEYGLTPTEVALVFAPGFVVFILLPEHAHRITDRVGRSWTMGVSFTAAALFAAGLAVISAPVAVAVLWTLVAACFAAQIPVEQATVAAVAGGRLGRAMGRYESARLAGVLVGPPLLGTVSEAWGWAAACLTSAAVSAAAAVAAPWAIHVLGLPERPPHERPAQDRPRASVPSAAEPVRRSEPQSVRQGEPEPAPPQQKHDRVRNKDDELGTENTPSAGALSPKEHARKERRDWLFHTVVFAVAQLGLWALDANWLAYRIQDEPIPDERGVLMWIGRIWLTIWIIDTLWSWSYTVFPRQKKTRSTS